jgi:hypothetical protein
LFSTCAIQKQQSRKRLPVRRNGDVPLIGQKRKKSLYFRLAHLLRMFLVVKENETLHPMHISLLGAQTEMAIANALTQLIEQFWWRRRCDGIHGLICLCLK